MSYIFLQSSRTHALHSIFLFFLFYFCELSSPFVFHAMCNCAWYISSYITTRSDLSLMWVRETVTLDAHIGAYSDPSWLWCHGEKILKDVCNSFDFCLHVVLLGTGQGVVGRDDLMGSNWSVLGFFTASVLQRAEKTPLLSRNTLSLCRPLMKGYGVLPMASSGC